VSLRANPHETLRDSCSVRLPNRTKLRGGDPRLGVSVRSDWTGRVVQLDNASCPAGWIGPIRFTRKLGMPRRPSIARTFSTMLFSKREQHDRPQLVEGELSRPARVNPQLTEACQTVESRLNRYELSTPKADIAGMFHFSASRSASRVRSDASRLRRLATRPPSAPPRTQRPARSRRRGHATRNSMCVPTS
jgi:hypothetical protein